MARARISLQIQIAVAAAFCAHCDMTFAQPKKKLPDLQVEVVNMIPASLSGEEYQDSEPNITVNWNNPDQMAASAFTPGVQFCGPNLAPIYLSNVGGGSWQLNCVVPSDESGLTSDITLRFAPDGGNLYAAILRRPFTWPIPRLNILRSPSAPLSGQMDLLVDRTGAGIDQPYIAVATTNGRDVVLVGENDFNSLPQSATVERSLDGANPTPEFDAFRVEARSTGTGGQDGPSVRTARAASADGIFYAAFFGWRSLESDDYGYSIKSDIVVVRDDSGTAGPNPFTALIDQDGLPGKRIVTDRDIRYSCCIGQQRFGSGISLAVDPNHSSNVYIAWADTDLSGSGGSISTIHVRFSTDSGQTWSSSDVRTVPEAVNPALAITSAGEIGFLYQQYASSSVRWRTYFESTLDQYRTHTTVVLADVPADKPDGGGAQPYIGDYVHLEAVGEVFYGVFSANNTPDMANFPEGVKYNRQVDWAAHQLYRTVFEGKHRVRWPVNPSIDPFFFRVTKNYGPICVRDPLICHLFPKWPFPVIEGPRSGDVWIAPLPQTPAIHDSLSRAVPGIVYRLSIEGLGEGWRADLYDGKGRVLQSRQTRGTEAVTLTTKISSIHEEGAVLENAFVALKRLTKGSPNSKFRIKASATLTADDSESDRR